MKRTWKQIIILNLSLTFFSACGNIPLINAVLGLPGSNSNGDISQHDDENVDLEDIYDSDPTESLDDIGGIPDSDGNITVAAIPTDSDFEITIETEDGGTTRTYQAPSTGAATTESSGSGSGDDATDSEAPGADAPQYFPSTTGTVDIPVSTSKDEEDACTAENVGEVMMIMASASMTQEMESTNSDTARRSQNTSNTSTARMSMTNSRSQATRPNHAATEFTLDAQLVQSTLTADLDLGSVDGEVEPQICEVEVDENGNTTHSWHVIAKFDAIELNLFTGHEIVVGQVGTNEHGPTHTAVSVPLQPNGTFHVESVLISENVTAVNYIGVLPRNTDLNVEPAEAIIIQRNPTEVRMDMTHSVTEYTRTDQISSAPTVRVNSTLR